MHLLSTIQYKAPGSGCPLAVVSGAAHACLVPVQHKVVHTTVVKQVPRYKARQCQSYGPPTRCNSVKSCDRHQCQKKKNHFPGQTGITSPGRLLRRCSQQPAASSQRMVWNLGSMSCVLRCLMVMIHGPSMYPSSRLCAYRSKRGQAT